MESEPQENPIYLKRWRRLGELMASGLNQLDAHNQVMKEYPIEDKVTENIGKAFDFLDEIIKDPTILDSIPSGTEIKFDEYGNMENNT